MPLESYAAVDADMYRAAVIEREAYETQESNAILFPGALPPGALQHRADGLRKKAAEQNVSSFKVVDTELEDGERMIAFAQWVVYDAGNPLMAPQPRQFPPQVNAEACDLLFNRLNQLEPKHMGDRPHVYFSIIFTDPKHQGRGAGTMLLRRCLEDAANAGLPIYLNASADAHELYLKHQFRDLELIETDFSKWGLAEPIRTWAMEKKL
ncbi:unnamed protein product [Discula destructiva]